MKIENQKSTQQQMTCGTSAPWVADTINKFENSSSLHIGQSSNNISQLNNQSNIDLVMILYGGWANEEKPPPNSIHFHPNSRGTPFLD